MKITQPFRIALIVNLIIPLSGVSTDIYLPSMPAMTRYFSCSNLSIQLTMTLFTLGLGLGQSIAGPISDSLGRKKIIVFALFFQLACLLIILMTHSVSNLLLARFIQGLGAAFMAVPARAMISDTFDGLAFKKQFTYLTASFALGPIIAPFLGGYLQHHLGWQANFLFLLIYIVLALLTLIIAIPDTLTTRTPLSVSSIIHCYKTVLSNHFFMVCTLLTSFIGGFIAVFNVTAPFIIQELLHQSAIFYGYMALVTGLSWFFGNMSNRLAVRLHWKKKTHILLPLMVLDSIVMLILADYPIQIIRFMAPIAIMFYLGGFLFPTLIAEILALFKTHAATANGLFNAAVWLTFSLFTVLGALLKSHHTLPIAFTYCAVSVGAYLWFLIIVRHTDPTP